MYDIRIIEYGDAGYPERLRRIANPPSSLWCIGNTELLRTPGIAVVGTRRCSPYGRWAAGEIAKRISAAGVTVISGMAEGIDAAGHWGALSMDRGVGKDDPVGKTVAVFGTGIDVCFPKSNSKLYREIAEKGLLISEYPPGTPGLPQNFPARNRIISGLSRSVVVVEGQLKSGSMITAGLALEQGRDVFAVPGNINQPGSKGVNKLIADGAFPIMDIDTVSQTLGIQELKESRTRAEMTDDERIMYDAVRLNPGITAEYMAMETGSSPNTILPLLGAMELKGLLARSGSRYYVK